MKAKLAVVVFASMLMLAGIFFESRPALAGHGDSQAITASEVVDRGTLKAFVIEGMNYFVEHVESDGIEHAKESLREGTAWKAGSVYLFILQEDGEMVFHGFNRSIEGRNPINTLVDAETGELVIPRIIDAARNPEGGFVQYHYDDPNDDTDDAEIPKVSYARVHDGIGGITQRLIFGAGIYLGSPAVIAARQNLAGKSALPQVMRAMTASTVDAVSGRIRQATSGTPPAKGFSLAVPRHSPMPYRRTGGRWGTARSTSAGCSRAPPSRYRSTRRLPVAAPSETWSSGGAETTATFPAAT